MPVDPFVVSVATLRRTVGSRRREQRQGVLDPEHLIPSVSVAESTVPEGAEACCDIQLASYLGGVMVTGTVSAPWSGTCRRCTAPVGGVAVVAVSERFTEPGAGHGDPEDDEAYPIEGEQLDLRPMIRDSVVLELPLAPLCRPDCAGLCPRCGGDRNEENCGCVAPPDPRWASLDVLRSTS
jgi:uncharacterized protein